MQDGTRLRLQTLATSDGARSGWYYFYDTQLAKECYFGRAGDGVQRCLPANAGLVSIYYTDAACSEPLLGWAPTLPTPDYAYVADARNCPTSTYYAVTGPYTGTPYWTATGSCTVAPVDGAHAYYGITPMAVSSFAAGSVSTSDGPFAGFASGSRLRIVTITSADGARTGTGYYDTQLGIDCYFGRAADGSIRCLPSTVGWVQGYFADAGCSERLVITNGCATPVYARTTATCGGPYFEVGALYTGATYYSNGASCSSVQSPTAFSLHQLGVAVPDSAFVAGTITP